MRLTTSAELARKWRAARDDKPWSAHNRAVDGFYLPLLMRAIDREIDDERAARTAPASRSETVGNDQ